MKNIKEEIKDISIAIVKAWNEGNYEAFMAQMDADAILLPNGGSSIVGIEAIRTVYKDYFKNFNYEVTESIDEITVSGEYCYAIGSWVGSMNPVDGSAPIHYNNKLLTIYKKQKNGTWRIYRNIFNSNQPQ